MMKWKLIPAFIIFAFIIFTSSCDEDTPVIGIGNESYETFQTLISQKTVKL